MKQLIRKFLMSVNRDLYFRIIDRKNIKAFKEEGRLDFEFNADNYDLPFLTNEFPETEQPIRNAPEKIYIFWTGTNEMPPHRKKGLQSLIEKSETEVIFITPDNLSEFILPDVPLHPAYEHLSLVHRSDYLRCYFMHHYGGGYADVKTYLHSWKPAFKKLNRNKDKYILGYRERSEVGVARIGGKIYDDMKKHHPLLIGNGSFICKPNTPLTLEWHNEQLNRLNHFLPDLIRHSAGEGEYPIPYTGLQGDIFHPLILKYRSYLLQDNFITCYR